jgi:hypothetical protein
MLFFRYSASCIAMLLMMTATNPDSGIEKLGSIRQGKQTFGNEFCFDLAFILNSILFLQRNLSLLTWKLS